jgi:hypothetical protein
MSIAIGRPLAMLLAMAALSLLPAQPGGAVEPRNPESRQQRHAEKLRAVRTVFVEPLHGERGNVQIRDMIIGSLHRLGLFAITEDEQQADAILRGSAQDLIYSGYLLQDDGLRVRGAASTSRREDSESNFGAASFGIGEDERVSRRERKHEAAAAVRLVLRDGEVIWSTTQESSGGKYRGPAADVAEKVAAALAKACRQAPEGRAPARP